MIRNNSYLVYATHHKEKAKTHKDFLYEMIKGLLTKAHFHAKHNPSRGGNTASAKRKHTEEPVFGIIKEVLGFKRFSLRGKENIENEW